MHESTPGKQGLTADHRCQVHMLQETTVSQWIYDSVYVVLKN